MEKLSVKKVVLVTETDSKEMAVLAKNNTSGNEAELIRRLLRLAIRHPEMFGLLDERQDKQ